MRLLYVAPRFHPNQYPILEGMINKGHQVYFLATKIGHTEKHGDVEITILEPSELTKRLEKKWTNKSSVYAEDKMIFWFVPNRAQLKHLIVDIAPDVVIVRDRNLLSLTVVRECRKVGINKILLYNQSPIYTEKDSFKKNVERRLWFSLFPKIRITTCEYRNFPPSPDNKLIKDDNARYLPFVPRNRAKNDRQYLSKGIVNILDCGKYRDYKNHLLLIYAAGILVERGMHNFKITILGQALNNDEIQYYERCKELIQHLHLDSYFRLENCVPYDEVPRYYFANDLFVLPSKSEQASVSCLDALSYGLPTISTSRNGTASYIKSGITGEVFQTNDSNDLANKIEIYLKNPNLIAEQGKNALLDIEQEFGFENYYRKFMQIINNL